MTQAAKTATENHDPGVDRGPMVFVENMAQPKMVNKPEVRQHNSKNQRSDKVCANHSFHSFGLIHMKVGYCCSPWAENTLCRGRATKGSAEGSAAGEVASRAPERRRRFPMVRRATV